MVDRIKLGSYLEGRLEVRVSSRGRDDDVETLANLEIAPIDGVLNPDEVKQAIRDFYIGRGYKEKDLADLGFVNHDSNVGVNITFYEGLKKALLTVNDYSALLISG